MNNPLGAAVDPSNNLYIADTGNNRVLGYNAPFGHGNARAATNDRYSTEPEL